MSSLKEYNLVQLEVMYGYFLLNKCNPDIDSPERRELEMKWVTDGWNEKFRDEWMKQEAIHAKNKV
jgi:hypothetical protein